MKVFKFGGASVRNAEMVKNVATVIQRFPGESLVMIVSAMGKTTNALEQVWKSRLENDGKTDGHVVNLIQFHEVIMSDLGFSSSDDAWKHVGDLFDALKAHLASPVSDQKDFEYDQIVSYGELISTRIVSEYLKSQALDAQWFDVRKLVRTNNNHREGIVDWDETEKLVQSNVGEWAGQSDGRIAMVQGFLGHTPEGVTTTLGREGSDYTGAIMAFCLNADSLTIWKDVPGVLNADPKWFDNTVKLDRISYREAIELSYYGASVIHPKTLKPLQNKQIPLYVNSFLNPEKEGTVIQTSTASDFLIPSFIFKMNQVLISISPRDFSFIVEQNLSGIYECFAKHKVKINLMQNSALNFSASVDDNERLRPLIEELKASYQVLYNEGLELVTIRHYDQQTIDRVTQNKTILVEQKSRFTARMVMRDEAGPYLPKTDYPN